MFKLQTLSTYPPKHHQIKNLDKMITLIKNYPLGMLISTHNEVPFITHIPIIYNDTTCKLVAHIDKYNPQVASLHNGARVTVVFKGPDCYVSPSIYHTKQLPTWNYMTVHVTGTITQINDPEKAKETMIAMTSFLEGETQKFTLLKKDKRMEQAVQYIQAFDITITNWEGKFKLSQDKHKKDQEAAKNELLKNTHSNKAHFIKKMYE